MCNSSGSSSSNRAMEDQLALQRNEIDRKRWEEDIRQARINQGMNTINQNFWELDQTQPRPDLLGLPTDPDGSFKDWMARQNDGKTVSVDWNPTGLSSVDRRMKKEARKIEDRYRVDVPEMPEGGFPDPNFASSTPHQPSEPFNLFDQRKQDYLNWAVPQVSQQFGDASNQQMFQLHRMGHGGGSSTMLDRQGRLQDDYTQARADTVDRGIDVANQARQDVNTQRSNLINLLHQTGDPSAISGQMSQVIDSLRAAPTFSPMGPMFQNATAGLGSYLDGLRFSQMQSGVNQTPIYSSPGTSSGRVVR